MLYIYKYKYIVYIYVVCKYIFFVSIYSAVFVNTYICCKSQ